MNWIKNFVRPKIRSILGDKREVPENMWIKDPESGQMVFYKDLEANQFVVPGSGYHWRMTGSARLKFLFDNGEYETLPLPEVPADPLKFRDERKYADRIKDARAKTGLNDAIKVGYGKLEGAGVVVAVQDFDFMGGSLGMAAGEAVVAALGAGRSHDTLDAYELSVLTGPIAQIADVVGHVAVAVEIAAGDGLVHRARERGEKAFVNPRNAAAGTGRNAGRCNTRPSTAVGDGRSGLPNRCSDAAASGTMNKPRKSVTPFTV